MAKLGMVSSLTSLFLEASSKKENKYWARDLWEVGSLFTND